MLLEIKNLIKRYNDFLALDHINLSISEGEIFGLLGPNGAGKTTTINILAGLTKPNDGEIRFMGKDLFRNGIEAKQQIGIVPQEIALFDDLTTYENLDYFGRLYGLRGKALKDRIQEALEFVGLADHCKDLPKKFSGGMKRRLNIACAILHRPKLIVMDEPTVGIDPQSRKHILESIKTLNASGATIIYTSHYMEEVEAICSKVAIIDRGRVIAQGTKSELTDLVAEEEKVIIELGALHYSLIEQIKSLPTVRDMVIRDRQLEIVCRKGEGNVNRIIQLISQSESEILSVTVEKPSLESVFLTFTGRSLRD